MTATVAIVLETYRSDSTDMVLDHELWLACMAAVTRVVNADRSELFAETQPRFLESIRKPVQGAPLGSLESYTAERFEDPDSRYWGDVSWYRGKRLVAAAMHEPWHRVGGPNPYHDSYTTCLFIDPLLAPALTQAIERQATQAGGRVEQIIPTSAPL